MDTGVLLNLIDDLIKEETKHDLTTKLRELISALSQSRQQNANISESINTTISQLKTTCQDSFNWGRLVLTA